MQIYNFLKKISFVIYLSLFSFVYACDSMGYNNKEVTNNNVYMNNQDKINYIIDDENMDYSETCSPSDCFIWYDNFTIARLYGLTEDRIVSHAIKYYFDENDFIKIIEKKTIDDGQYCDDYHYCKYDVKAKIVIHDQISYIDGQGYMRTGDDFYKINKQALMDIIDKKDSLSVTP